MVLVDSKFVFILSALDCPCTMQFSICQHWAAHELLKNYKFSVGIGLQAEFSHSAEPPTVILLAVPLQSHCYWSQYISTHTHTEQLLWNAWKLFLYDYLVAAKNEVHWQFICARFPEDKWIRNHVTLYQCKKTSKTFTGDGRCESC